MKKLPFIILSIASALVMGAGSVRPNSLTWDDPNPAGFVGSYNVWDGTNKIATVGTNIWRITGLSPGLHQISVSAVATNGIEGDNSTNITIASVVAVVNLRLE